MRCKVREAFDYAHDGVNIKPLNAGEEAEIRDHLVAGLVKAGKLADPNAKGRPAKTDPKPAPAAETPAPEGDEGGEGGESGAETAPAAAETAAA